MTKELSKQIMKRSKSKNLYCASRDLLGKTSWPIKMKKKNNKCNNMTKYAKKAYFQKVTAKKVVNHFGIHSNPFSLTEKS